MNKTLTLLAIALAVSLPACRDQTHNINIPPPTVIDVPAPHPTPSPTPTNVPYSGDPTFQKYLNDFAADGRDYAKAFDTKYLSINFGSLAAYGSTTIGLCSTGSKQQAVTIKKSWWDQVSETQRRLLIHHELGHCLLFRGHRSDTLPGGAPASIMYPVILSTAVFSASERYYLEELFTFQAETEAFQDYVCTPESLQ